MTNPPGDIASFIPLTQPPPPPAKVGTSRAGELLVLSGLAAAASVMLFLRYGPPAQRQSASGNSPEISREKSSIIDGPGVSLGLLNPFIKDA